MVGSTKTQPQVAWSFFNFFYLYIKSGFKLQALIPDPLGDPSPSSNRKLLVGADIFNGSGISPKEKLGKKYIYIICQVSSGRVGPAVFKLDNGSGIL